VERSAIYLGKLLGVLIIMAIVDALLIPIVGLLFQAPLTHAPLLLVGLIVSGTVGFAIVGTLFAAMLVRAQGRDVLLPWCCIR
jgi:ABC-type transport system involved in cytochrome c biogenesis permease component